MHDHVELDSDSSVSQLYCSKFMGKYRLTIWNGNGCATLQINRDDMTKIYKLIGDVLSPLREEITDTAF
jgi:hypothetical protein